MEKRNIFDLEETVTKTTDGSLDDTLHTRSHDQIQVLWLVTLVITISGE